ncbi:unnamed protein product (macronuclear) [Paramecium tetraurelia]|uniref:t-SNARE coiled-coil homology domain-containing protein n=1 Tax=Paramecium tetraurelia TaxID=5888 RepID=A0CUX8_PARTE|nr:uncharacterized protein GSPATT00010763001 [Paramecium tetraurelia]CAK74595.1 unnamed protein product [Paramecium tetraurelia]|eukprot:XP_001441992.1 hypothetical protein (macronuclear) [Paramecium tetraurelia strain d4-2]
MFNEYDDQLQQNIDQFHYLLVDTDCKESEKQQYLNQCKQQSEKIKKLIQQRIKSGNENQTMRYMKQFSSLNKKLQEMEYNYQDEHISLILENNQDRQLEVQLFEENVNNRKQRLQSIHKNMGKVQSIYDKISQLAHQQVDSIFQVEQDFAYAEEKTQKASQELTRTQQSQKSNVGYRFVIICILVFIVIILFIK